ncbi:MAG: hypothetical protein M1835_006163 [Candelina submexicana]|nr:MAG: hypothetical protein M1835_006163 [Candelina submexicana]
MSFLTHHSRHSWPPFVHFATSPAVPQSPFTNPTIDEDPFSFFVSPDPSEGIDSIDDWTAGITSSVSAHKSPSSIPVAASASPLSRFRFHRNTYTATSSITEAAKTPTAILRRWTAYVEKHQPQLLFRHQTHSSSRSSSPASSPASSPRLGQAATRGRGTDELAARARGRTQSRSRSSRPHSWREPSMDLYTLPEEREGGEDVKGGDVLTPSGIVRSGEQRARL